MTPKAKSRAEAKASGIKRYFTGRPCPHGHIAERLTVNGLCVECTRKYLKTYRAENEDQRDRAEYMREYRIRNRERLNEYQRQRYDAQRHHAMTPTQYKTAIEQLGLSQEASGIWLGVSKRTGQNYAAKGPPEPVAKLLRLMLRLKLKPDEVK